MADWIVVRDTHDRIVSRSTFEAARRIREGRDHTGSFRHVLRGRGHVSNFLLTGLIRCKACGHTYQGYSQKYRWKKPDRPPEARRQSYACGGWTSKGLAVCKRNGIEKGPFEEFIIRRVHARLLQVLDDGGLSLLRAYVREELAQAMTDPKRELRRVEGELSRLRADSDRLLANLTENNREFIDEKLIEIKHRRVDLERQREALEEAADRHLDLDAATEAALGYLGRFRDVLEQGTFAEQKAFVGSFVTGIEYDPDRKAGTLHMRDMIASSFKFIGWTRPKLYR